ncbi:MAG: polyprenyl synthetase family protein [Acidimicrobiia bacterium]|nr:polyprenyl synthetase family protein [bacterium]MDE0675578.1 polyprenyl synthetase family protein [bacterium]MXX45755.1 polyprenyl synthetase family protein [Acidimicrobiia bacterium]MYD41248.1 polyprenyl synthetase family protein [Acidimicrobiia bacterium]
MKRRTSEVLEWARTLVEPALKAATGRLSPELGLAARYHFGWVDSRGAPLPEGRHGKGVRPTLALLSAEAAGAPAEVALPGAVAVELVHNFSLVHDDIVDNDAERRHRATVWKVFGVGDAIIVGDAMMGLAFELLLEESTPARSGAARDLVQATMAMIAGQYMDMSFNRRDTVGVAECWEMVSAKTGALLAYASAVGAILADAPPRTVGALRRFGQELGLCFQAVDDLLGIWGEPSVTGKPAGNDLRERKKSLPVAVALSSGTRAGETLADLYAQEHLDDEDIARAATLVEEAGGRAATAEAARDCMHRAAQALTAADLEQQPAEELLDLASFVVNREF